MQDVPRESAAERHLEIQGVRVPKLGFGTWQITGRECEAAVRDALELGYRHLDTARIYENEAEVGAGLASSGVDRSEVFVTTKVWHMDGGLSAGGVRRQCEGSLRALGVEYVDLLLIHWPDPGAPLGETLGEMLRLRDEGKASNLGVSNFPSALMLRALEEAPLLANQVEYHVYLPQPALLELAHERDFTLTAYSPVAHGEVQRDPVLQEIGEAHGRGPAQVALRWLLDQPKVSVVPKAASHENRAANLEVFDFELTDAERGRIAELADRGLRTIEPAWAPDWD